MPPEKTKMEDWLDAILDDKLNMKYYSHEETIKTDYKNCYRLDHQGLNENEAEGPYVHRIYVRPVGATSRTKHKDRKNSSNSVICRCHATDSATPDEIRAALLLSFKGRKEKPAVCGFAPPKE